MLLNRRSFLVRAGVGAATTAAASARLLAQQHRIERLGMQLYTVRDAMAKDFDGTLAKVAALGDKEVEFAGYFNKSPQEVKAALAKNGLTSPSTHIGYDLLTDKFPQVIEDSRTIGTSSSSIRGLTMRFGISRVHGNAPRTCSIAPARWLARRDCSLPTTTTTSSSCPWKVRPRSI
jgi:hypothetical protein